MSFLAKPVGLTSAQFPAYAAKLKWAAWKPKFVVLHNSGEPNLAQWTHGSMGLKDGARRLGNLNHYYQSLGWHSGPHLFIAPDLIWVACDLTRDGVHASCFNKFSLGVEMVGDYGRESFVAGDGAKVRDNTVAALATLHKALGIRPDGYALGKSGLHFHKECLRDRHDCPGKNVSKPDMVKRVLAAMETAK